MAKKKASAKKVGKPAYGAAAARHAATPKPRSFGNQHPGMKTPPPTTSRVDAPPAGTAAPAAPAAPARVDPFWNGDDLAAINDFTTRYATDFANIDFGLGTQQQDTDYQKTQTNGQAKEATAGTQDAMIARGLFRSSVKDAALYDIEAQRALSTKFLDDKMTAATLNAGTQKKILADSKKRFDDAMLAKQTENAAAANETLSSAWADQMATWTAAHPAKPAAAPAAPGKPKPAASAGKPGGTTAVRVPGSGQVGAGAGSVTNAANTASGAGRTGSSASAKQTYRWPDGKQHSRPYRGN